MNSVDLWLYRLDLSSEVEAESSLDLNIDINERSIYYPNPNLQHNMTLLLLHVGVCLMLDKEYE